MSPIISCIEHLLSTLNLLLSLAQSYLTVDGAVLRPHHLAVGQRRLVRWEIKIDGESCSRSCQSGCIILEVKGHLATWKKKHKPNLIIVIIIGFVFLIEKPNRSHQTNSFWTSGLRPAKLDTSESSKICNVWTDFCVLKIKKNIIKSPQNIKQNQEEQNEQKQQ